MQFELTMHPSPRNDEIIASQTRQFGYLFALGYGAELRLCNRFMHDLFYQSERVPHVLNLMLTAGYGYTLHSCSRWLHKALTVFERVRVLVLLNINGSLVFKASRAQSRDLVQSIDRRPDWSDRYNDFYLRPYVSEFLNAMLWRGSKIAFAVYTSRQPHNAVPQIRELGHQIGKPRLVACLHAVFAGEAYSYLDETKEPPEWRRVLADAWKHFADGPPGHVNFDARNTLNIDDKADKLLSHPGNAVVISSYDAEALAKDQGGNHDKTLLRLRRYLLKLASECGEDVRDYLQQHPFSTSQ